MKLNRRFDDKILAQKNAWLWAWFDIPGGVWLTFYSGSLLALWWLAWVGNRDIPTGIVATYSVIVTAFAASNIVRWYSAVKERLSRPTSDSSSSQES